MKIIKTNKFIVIVLINVLLLTACSSYFNANNTNSKDLMTLVKYTSWPTAPNTIDSKYKDALLDFSWSIFQEISQNDGNVLISPASIYLALGMTYNGANNETHEAMAETLKAVGISEEEFNTACRDYISILNTTGEKTELSVANSIWYRQGFNPDIAFLQKNADYFGAAAYTLDFDNPKSVEVINNWVKDQTKDTIEKIIDKINEDNVMYLINAVYFKSTWQNPFEPNNTRESEFKSPDGSVMVKFMNQTGTFEYINQEDISGVMMPYDDGRFSFFALLPKEGKDIRSFIKEIDGDKVSNYLLAVQKGHISISLPKFETEFSDSIKDELTNMGMGIAFDLNKADFSRMNKEHKKNLFINDILHKTYCLVDESGTEASAVTSVEMSLTSAPMEPDIQIIFDRPFVYGIVDTVTGAPLFLGIMETPS